MIKIKWKLIKNTHTLHFYYIIHWKKINAVILWKRLKLYTIIYYIYINYMYNYIYNWIKKKYYHIYYLITN